MNKKTTSIKSLTLLITLFFAVSFGFGQIVAWDFNGKSGNEVTVPATTLTANLNPSIISRGSGINPSGLLNAFSSNNFTPSGTQLNAITTQRYLQFQISASSGYQVSLSTLDANFRRSPSDGPVFFIWRYSIDGTSFTDIGSVISYTSSTATNGTPQTQINLSTIPALQNVVSGTTITFRLYGWGAISTGGTFAIGRLSGNDLSIGGTVTVAPPCPTSTTWTAGAWTNGLPNSLTKSVIINDNFTTSPGNNIIACSLTINPGVTLNVADNTFVEVEHDVIVDGGTISLESFGAFVQRGENTSAGSFSLINGGSSNVFKFTATKQQWYYYTYWSSPVENETVDGAFPDTDLDRRFLFNAANYLDLNGDGTDDTSGWQIANGGDTLIPGVGYAATSGPFGLYPSVDSADFNGAFNSGDISTAISYNALNIGGSWNFIGNPYPCALDFDLFYDANSTVIDAFAYYWSQASPPDILNPGNEVYNFSQNDYAIYSVLLGGGVNNGNPLNPPTKNVPSAQGFFVNGLTTGNVTFTNTMRIADGTSNSTFFKNVKNKNKTNSQTNKLWVNLSSDNGVSGQILIGYVDGATKGVDGLYDAPKLIVPGNYTSLYSTIEGSNKNFAIQGRADSDLTEDEVIKLGFNTSIIVPTIYTLSIAQLEGDFLSNNKVYLKDNLLNTLHELSASDYNFTSEVGAFKDRFEIVFNSQALSADAFNLDANAVQIIQVDDAHVTFKASNNLNIKTVAIYDLLGRQLYQLDGSHPEETYNLSNLNHSVFIAKVELSNGALITKKAIKK